MISYPTEPSPAQPRRHIWGLLAALLAASALDPAQAHDVLSQFIQHRLELAVGPEHIEVTVRLTFFEEWSERERRRMDADGDGRIRRAEIESYLKQSAAAFNHQVRLKCDGQPVVLIPLYAPAVDLLGSDQVGPAHHQLTLFYFAPTPPALAAGSEIALENALWPTAPALASLQVPPRGGSRIEPAGDGDPVLPPLAAGQARVFKAHCRQPPDPPAETASRSGPPGTQTVPHRK